MDGKLWYKNAVFYEVYARAYKDSDGDGNGDLPGLTQKLDYLKDLGVDCIWLLPIYPSPLRDDGYDIADYYGVLSEYGDMQDFVNLIEEAHARGMKVIADLVLNHTSDQHPWFQAARSDPNSPYRDYYVWADDPSKYSDARIIFIDFEQSNWTYDEVAKQYFWHRFYSSQPDLNYDNPAVREEMKKVIGFWMEKGIDGFRADAVPYLIEREGTNCENLPETHVYLKEVHNYVEENFPEAILLCEANQWPQDLRPYFGTDGDEFQLAFHFPLMPRIYLAIKSADRTPMVWVMEHTPPIPDNCQWCTFLRNHDELTLEMVTPEERQWMWEQYAPEERMRLNLGIRRRLAPLLDNDRRKIEMANSLIFTLPGTPIVYYGDEIGMGDNIWLPDRNGVRTPMQWNTSQNAGFSSAPHDKLYAPVIEGPVYGPQAVNVEKELADPDSLLNWMKHAIAVRKQYMAFGFGDFTWIDTSSDAIAAYRRHYQGETLLIFNNLSAEQQTFSVRLPEGTSAQPQDILTGQRVAPITNGHLALDLSPYGYRWLKL